jgi:MoaA/NifB/PqqE/SkfB family radical SAM enzyme
MKNTWTYTENKLIMYIEVSSMCNALSPQCDRYKPGTLNIHDHVPNTYWSLEQFKTAFTVEDLKLIKVVNFAGLYGDPATNPYIQDMIAYVVDNSDCWVIIETNGSLKTPAWWAKLAQVGGWRLKVQFDVDGATQETHARYRGNTNLDKILTNIKAYTDAGGKAKVMTILFKHNENELPAIRDLTMQAGATEWDSTQSLRFYQEHDYYTYVDHDGVEHTLETATRPKRSNSPLRRMRNFDKELTAPAQCPNAAANFLQVDSFGNVWPCCDILEAHERGFEDVEYTDHINLFQHSLAEIIDSDWYQKFTTKYKQCAIWCSSNTKETP